MIGYLFPLVENPLMSIFQCCREPPAAGEIHRLKKQRSPARFLACDCLVKHNRHFHRRHNRLNLIFSWEPNFLATTLIVMLMQGQFNVYMQNNNLLCI